jgi:two-component system OmpR family sensor kinase
MTETAASIVNADDLKKRLPVAHPMDELGHLASVFNQTLERLENLFRVQQRFVGDVSHELRTPLTSILGNLEIMQRYGYDEESLNAVYREAERMSRMANDLLLLARADNGELKIELTPIDLDPIVVEVYETVADAGEETAS